MKKTFCFTIFTIALFAFINDASYSQALNQGFNSPSFPPSGWTQTPGLWSRSVSSAFGVGQGSAIADFYNIQSGTFDITSPSFTATGAGDSLIFANAYRTYIDENDQLEILYSTNGGSSYITLIILDGGISGPLVTAPPDLDEWLSPAPNEWKFQRLALPVGTNKLKFNGITAYGNNLFVDSIYVKNALVGIQPAGNVIPAAYSLEQNYPNPFNPETNIKFGIPVSGNVKLAVFDMLGREVVTLINESKTAGNYVVDFDASNLSSGAYFYRIQSGNFTETKKMFLVK